MKNLLPANWPDPSSLTELVSDHDERYRGRGQRAGDFEPLAPPGVCDIEMPATPARVWRAIRDAGWSGALPQMPAEERGQRIE